MRTILNFLWLITGGIWLWLGYMLAGIVACVLIVTIPAGVASFRIAQYVLWPFGHRIVEMPNAGAMSCVSNVIWMIVAGIPLAFGHLVTALTQIVTIIGIPLAIANLKMLRITLVPFGKQVISDPKADILSM